MQRATRVVRAAVAVLCAASVPAQSAEKHAAPRAPEAYAKPRLFAYGFAAGPHGGAWQVAAADLNGDGFDDVVAVHRENGAVHVLDNVAGGKCAPRGEVLAGDGPAEDLRVERDADGRRDAVLVLRAGAPARRVERRADGTYGRDTVPATTTRGAAASAPASRRDDAVAVLAAWRSGFPALRDGAPDLERALVVRGEFTGDGVGDALVVRRDGTWRVGHDVSLMPGIVAGAADRDQDGLLDDDEARRGSDPLDGDTDHDGLLDAWEVRGGGGLDLPALGCSPVRQDCVVYCQRHEGLDGAEAGTEIGKAVATWAALPTTNPDGSTGIALRPVWLAPLAAAKADRGWGACSEENLPAAARGFAHYMILGPGGGGQAAELGDAGGCGRPLWATFLHEFGHQVGLTHSGGPGPGLCPTYTSLMSYAYSYGFSDEYARIHYSRGALKHLVLDETALSERLATPFASLSFLARGPYRFKVEADGEGCRVDWNRNGRFDAAPVRADVTDVYGADGGLRHTVGKTVYGPALVAHRGALAVFGVGRDGGLYARRARGEGDYDEALPLPRIRPRGDLAATSTGAEILLAAPTETGIVCAAAPDLDALAAAAPAPIPDSVGASVSLFSAGGRAAALLWNDAATPVRVAERGDDGAWTAPRATPLRSTFPPGATFDAARGGIVVGFGAETTDGGAVRRDWRVAALRRAPDVAWSLADERVVGGKAGWHGNARPVLVVEPDLPSSPAPGRLHFVARGYGVAPQEHVCFFEAIEIGDRAQDDGWRLRRFYDEWTTTKSPVAACLHDGDLVLAYRWFGNVHGDDDENLQVAHRAFGVRAGPMSDFDDVAEISERGLSRSIPYLRRAP
jgi:hypothetical protein